MQVSFRSVGALTCQSVNEVSKSLLLERVGGARCCTEYGALTRRSVN